MNKILLIIVPLISSIYSLQFQTAEGNIVNMSEYQGKKILLVNIATASNKINQLAELQQLQQLYPDSLNIIAFPSNSFGNETRTNAEIHAFCQANYGVSFAIAQKNNVIGQSIQPIYQWLSDSTKNGLTNISVAGDFQKVLLSRNGEIVGIFAPVVSPLDSLVKNAIIGN